MKQNKCIQLVKLAGSRGRLQHFCWQWLCCQSLSEAAVTHSPSPHPTGVHCARRQPGKNRSWASGRRMEWICQSLSLIINFCHSEPGDISCAWSSVIWASPGTGSSSFHYVSHAGPALAAPAEPCSSPTTPNLLPEHCREELAPRTRSGFTPNIWI